MKRAILLSMLACAFASPAFAETKADALFKKGKQLLAEKRYAAACEAFEESDKLDPGIGAKLNVAKCFEEWGKLTKALVWYKQAEEAAIKQKDEREAKIKELIAALDTDIPRLTIRVPPKANLKGAGVRLNGTPVEKFDEPILLDPGPHEVQYIVNNETRKKTIQLERGGERELTLELTLIPEAIDDKKQQEKKPPPPPPSPGRTRRIIGISMAGAGVVGLGVASYLTLDARGTYKDALDAHCGGMANGCNDEGLRITKDARSQANTATIITLASVAVAAGGVVLYLTAPKSSPNERRRDDEEEEDAEARYIMPVVGPGVGGVVWGGTF